MTRKTRRREASASVAHATAAQEPTPGSRDQSGAEIKQALERGVRTIELRPARAKGTATTRRRIQRYGWDRAAESYEPFWQQQLAPAIGACSTSGYDIPGEFVVVSARRRRPPR